ncbi:Retrovirus-related Pol polyprotein from transposon 17.6, partial [Blattella germanica]
QETDLCRRPIAYTSRTLSEQERKFLTYGLESLAVLFGVEKFKLYLEHVQFLLETDNEVLSWVLGLPRKTGCLAARISAFKFAVKHIKGSENVIADILP